MYMADVSQNIRRQRLLIKMSQTQLAEKLSVTRQTVSSWERGNSYPDVMMLESLAAALETDVNSLIYPAHSAEGRAAKSQPLGMGFVVKSLFVYILLLILGAGPAIGLFKLVLGGGVAQEYIYFACWGLVLMVGYIAYAVCVISEYFAGYYERGDEQAE